MLRISSLTSPRSDAPPLAFRANGLDYLLGGGHSDVGRDQRFLERVDRLDINRLAALLRLVRPLDYFLESLDELLFRPRQRLFDLVEKTH